jgi:threonine dehydrogenase-like Zn-dependent dehydrogenase
VTQMPQLGTNRVVGVIKPEGMITRKIKLDEVAEKGFVALTEDKDNHVKILVDIGAGI